MPPTWLTADANGSVKRVSSHFTPDVDPKYPDLKFSLVAEPVTLQAPGVPSQSIHRLSIQTHVENRLLAAAYADGCTRLYDANPLNSFKSVPLGSPIAEWKEPLSRFNATSDRWVGLDICPSVIIQCSQKGLARLLELRPEDRPTDSQDPSKLESHTCNVPMGIRHFKAAPSGAQFAYAGQEVNLSIWDAERAFATAQDGEPDKGSKKRGREGLFPAEMWRAKNIANDSLDLRQPVDISSLAFLDSQSDATTKSLHRIAVGNSLGFVHQYDIRKGKKPTSSWKDERMGGGIALVEKGHREHELYIADSTTQLWSIDLRKPSGPLYAYKGLSGKVTSIARSTNPEYMLVGSLDRNVRLLTPAGASDDDTSVNKELSGHGKVVGKLYVTAAPNAIVCLNDGTNEPTDSVSNQGDEDGVEEGVQDDIDWDDLQEVSSEEDSGKVPRKRQRRA